MTGELQALRGWRGTEDPGLVEAIAKRVDAEIGRQLRRTWAIATVAGGLVVAGAAGVATHMARGRVGVTRAG